MFVVRKLVQGLIEYIETGNFPFRPGILRDRSGNPILDIASLIQTDIMEQIDMPNSVKEWGETLLNICAVGDFDRLDGAINSQGNLDYSLFSYTDSTAIMVPCISTAEQIPFAIVALARMADTGSGDSVAHRIAKCEWCNKFFIRKTKKRSRFHSRACRIKHMNRERLKSGWFKEYYRRRKALHSNDLQEVVVSTT